MNALPAPMASHIFGIHKPYVPIAEVEDYLRVGWMPLPRLQGGLHPYVRDSVHVVWPCKCKMVIPGRSA